MRTALRGAMGDSLRWILHADVDAFFASVEQARDPALQGRPVIVGGDGDQRTVVASCSYEARARGVRNAMPTAEAKRRCPDAVFRPGCYRVYREAAEEVWQEISELSPLVQRVSLDGAYADLQEGGIRTAQDALRRAEELCSRVRERTRLFLSAGVGTSRLMARVATGLAKPKGCFLVLEGHERALLHPLSIRHLPGVGPSTAEVLESFSVRTVGDLACVPRDLLVRTFGRRGDALYQHARGIDPSPVAPPKQPQSISRETSLEPPMAALGPAFGMATYLLERAMKEAIGLGLRVGTLALRLRFADGVTSEEGRAIRPAARHEASLVPVVQDLLKKLWTRRTPLTLVGVVLRGLSPRGDAQGELFPDPDEERWDRIGVAVERIRARHGFGSILRGPALDLMGTLPCDRDGFVLRIPSLTR